MEEYKQMHSKLCSGGVEDIKIKASMVDEIAVGSHSAREAVGLLQQEAILQKVVM